MFAQTTWNRLILAVIFMGLAVGGPSTQAQQTDASKKSIVVASTSGESEIELAKHLQQRQAKLYGAYWCVHCYQQMYLFGREALRNINRTECASDGKDARPDDCRAAKVGGFPTWEIDGKLYPGQKSLAELANLSNYHGPRNFRNSLATRLPEGLSRGTRDASGNIVPDNPGLSNSPNKKL